MQLLLDHAQCEIRSLHSLCYGIVCSGYWTTTPHLRLLLDDNTLLTIVKLLLDDNTLLTIVKLLLDDNTPLTIVT